MKGQDDRWGSTFFASFSVRHPSWTRREIAEGVGAEPEFGDVAGQPRMTPSGKPHSRGGLAVESFFSFDVGKGDGRDLETTIDAYTNKLLERREFFAALRDSGGESEFVVSLFLAKSTNGVMFEPVLSRKLADLGITLGISLYNYDPERRA